MTVPDSGATKTSGCPFAPNSFMPPDDAGGRAEPPLSATMPSNALPPGVADMRRTCDSGRPVAAAMVDASMPPRVMRRAALSPTHSSA